MESHVKSLTIRGFGKNSLRKGKCLFKFVHPLTQCLLLSMTFSNIHRQYGYFSKDKTNSSLQLFITRTRELPGDAAMAGESTPQRRKRLVDAGNSSARKVEKPLSKPGVRFCYASYIISCRHAVQYTVVSFSPPVTCICNDRYFLLTAPGRSRSLKLFFS